MVDKTVAKTCKCSKCEVETVSIPGTKHRNCSGEPGKEPRHPSERVKKKNRGEWL